MNSDMDAAAKQAGAHAAQRFDEDYALGMRENANRDALAKAAGQAAARQFDNAYALGMRENGDRNQIARNAARQGRETDHDLTTEGIGAGLVGGAIIGGLRYTLTPAIDVARTTDVMAADMRLTPSDTQSALDAARATTRGAPGSTIGENLAGLLDLKNVFGDMEEAKKLLPEFARMTTLLQTISAAHGGPSDQAFAAAKTLEIMGGMIDEHQGPDGNTVRTINPELGMARLKMMERAAVATNSRVKPSDYLGFAKQARVAGMTLSDEFIYEKLPAMIQTIGGPRTGTALMSMAQVFEGGHLTPKSMLALQDIGLAAPGGVEEHVGGRRNRQGQMVGGHDVVHTDAIYDLDMMRHDPLAYTEAASRRMDQLRSTAHPDGIHGTEAQAIALMKASQRSTIAGALADFLKDNPAILKEQQNIRNTRPDMAEHMAAVDPAAKVRQFEAALTNLATELGSAGMGDAMKVLDSVTAGLNRLGDWAKEHPTMARVMFDTAAGLGAIGVALGTLSTAIFLFGPALRLLGVGGTAAGVEGAAGTGVSGLAAGAAGAVGGGLAIPLTALALGGYAAVNAGLDPEYAEKEKARQMATSRASAASARSSPQSADFVPGDGFTVDGRPIQLTGTVNLDGKKVGDILAKGMSGPNQGSTGADTRAVYSGGMSAH